MKGPGIKDYLKVIEDKKLEAKSLGKKFIEIKSKELHEEVSSGFATMPTCCQAMYKLILVNDEILRKPKGMTGFGSYLEIRYYVEDLNREVMFTAKKRGRPAKSDEEKLIAKKAKMKRNSEDLSNLIKSWLNEHDYKYEEDKDVIIAYNEKEKWIINVQGIKRGRKQTLPVRISEVIKKMDDMQARYSIAFNDSLTYRRQWNEIPTQVRKQLNMSVILADKKGNIIEI